MLPATVFILPELVLAVFIAGILFPTVFTLFILLATAETSVALGTNL